MAIGVILTAVALVVALGIALTYSMRAGSAVSETNSQALLASTLINQAATLKSALVVSTEKDTYYEALHTFANQAWDQTNNTDLGIGIYNPSQGAADPQTPPPGSITSSSTGWRWSGYNWSTPIDLPGQNNYYYLISLSYVQPAVCAQINKQLTGSTAIPVVTTTFNLQTISGWNNVSNNAAYSALSGYLEICFVDSTNNYQYYRTIVDDSA
jgi:hypothetical protein